MLKGLFLETSKFFGKLLTIASSIFVIFTVLYFEVYFIK
jgi:hypothetical protein